MSTVFYNYFSISYLYKDFSSLHTRLFFNFKKKIVFKGYLKFSSPFLLKNKCDGFLPVDYLNNRQLNSTSLDLTPF